MRFWDASAVVAVVVPERRTDPLRERLQADGGMVVWWGTRVECISAIRRREREGVEIGNAPELLGRLATEWAEIQPSERIGVSAERLLAVHPLRAADALQLAAATAWRGDLTRDVGFACFDDRLRDAAAREGFEVLPELGA